MLKNKRGISPLIATVLVIGFTIVLAALVIVWGTDVITGVQESSDINSQIATVCSTGISHTEIKSVSYKGTTLTITIDNKNDYPVEYYKYRAYNEDGETLPSIAKKTKFLAGDIKTIEFVGVAEGPTSVGIIPVIKISGDDKEHTCSTEFTKTL